MITRREFLAISSIPAAARLATHAHGGAHDFAPTKEGPNARSWYTTMRRCGQININERDPIDMDVDRWIGTGPR